MFNDTELNSQNVAALKSVLAFLMTALCLSSVPLVLLGQAILYKKITCIQNEKQDWGNGLSLPGTPDITKVYGLQEQYHHWCTLESLGNFKKISCLDPMSRDSGLIVLGWHPDMGIFFRTFQDSDMQLRWRSTDVTSQILERSSPHVT